MVIKIPKDFMSLMFPSLFRATIPEPNTFQDISIYPVWLKYSLYSFTNLIEETVRLQ